MTETERYTLRPAKGDELAYLMKTHIHAVQPTAGKELPGFYAVYAKVFFDILKRSSAYVAVNDSDRILGFVIAEPARCILHSLYVRVPLRERGIAKDLMRAVFRTSNIPRLFFTHRPPHFRIQDDRKWFYNPYLIAMDTNYDPTETKPATEARALESRLPATRRAATG